MQYIRYTIWFLRNFKHLHSAWPFYSRILKLWYLLKYPFLWYGVKDNLICIKRTMYLTFNRIRNNTVLLKFIFKHKNDYCGLSLYLWYTNPKKKLSVCLFATANVQNSWTHFKSLLKTPFSDRYTFYPGISTATSTWFARSSPSDRAACRLYNLNQWYLLKYLL